MDLHTHLYIKASNETTITRLTNIATACPGYMKSDKKPKRTLQHPNQGGGRLRIWPNHCLPN